MRSNAGAWIVGETAALIGCALLTSGCGQALPVGLGYAEHVPTALIDLRGGTVVQISEVQYQSSADGSMLAAYKERITLPSGRVVTLQFADIGHERASVTIDGRRRRMPAATGLKKNEIPGNFALAPAFKAGGLASAVNLPCAGPVQREWTVRYSAFGQPLESEHTVTCDKRSFTFTFADWTPEDKTPIARLRVEVKAGASASTPTPTPTPDLGQDPAAFCGKVDVRLARMIRSRSSDGAVAESLERSDVTIRLVVAASSLTALADYTSALQRTLGVASVDLEGANEKDARVVGRLRLVSSDPDLVACVSRGFRQAHTRLSAPRPRATRPGGNAPSGCDPLDPRCSSGPASTRR